MGATNTSPPITAVSDQKIWSRHEIATRILAGETLFIFNGQLIRIPTSWLNAHPGGSLAILHFVGRDATDEILAYHPVDTLKRFKSYVIGLVETEEHGWEPLVPPVMSGWIRKIGSDGHHQWLNEADAIRSSENSPTSPSSQILLVKDSLLQPT